MELIYKDFAILSPHDKKAFEINFTSGVNLVYGQKDSGKSTISRAMMYTFGCDVKNFSLNESHPNNIYILRFTIQEDVYILLRKKLKSGKGKNFFKIYKNEDYIGSFYSTKEFTNYLNQIFNISVVTMDNESNETKLYPNHIFSLFYTDQDNSWQNYLSSTFSNLAFIKQYRKIILEYFTGSRTNEYYDLRLNQQKKEVEINQIKALLDSKKLIFKENQNNIKIIENVNEDEFIKQYELVLRIHQNIINTEHELKKNINKRLYQKNKYIETYEVLTTNINDYIEPEIDDECPNCHQHIVRGFQNDYELFVARENLINERDKVRMFLEEINKELEKEKKELRELKKEDVNIRSKLDADGSLLQLSERADSYALNRINMNLEKEIDVLKNQLDELKESKKIIDSKVRKQKDIDLSQKYKELMKESFDLLSIEFSYKSFYDNNFESVKISLSGTTKVQAFIVQYLTIYKLMKKNKGIIKIPMIIDSYLKDHFSEHDADITTKYIFDTLIENSHQAFVFITDNEQTKQSINFEEINTIKLNEVRGLLTDNYDKVYQEYGKYVEGELD
ncbi:ATP-binding protein [Paenibacillus sp. FSL H7-0690]|uniref:ATP-binding protein n=1 Tax=Paenibacillus sp. FSL H7-0690 TaxID=2921437 RepID=UPI0030EC967F